MSGDPYKHSFLKTIPRLLSIQDRDPFSPTYGCFDRSHWQWKFTDFPGARFQEGAAALALLYANSFDDNIYHGNTRILEWIKAALNYWARIQYGDGSFDEAYPCEHSFAATAFTSFYISEALLILGESLSADCLDPVIEALRKSAEWLIVNREQHAVISNHLSAACAALGNIYTLTGQNRYKKRAGELLGIISDNQSREGWLSEYGGPDIGYQSHTTFYLARYYQRSEDTAVLEILEKAIQFARYFVHPNGTMGGEYCSRNTEFYSPGGFEMLSSQLPTAKAIADRMLVSVENATAAGLEAMDRYNFMPLLTSYIIAYLEHRPDAESCDLPYESNFERYFEHAHIYVTRNDAYYAILGLSKGGVLKAYEISTGKLVISDCGYMAIANNGRQMSNQYFSLSRNIQRHDRSFEVSCPFFSVPRNIFTPGKFIMFRCFSCIPGRIPILAVCIKRLLVKALIHGKKELPLSLRRKVVFHNTGIAVEDRIERFGKIKIGRLIRGDKFATVHMGSSQYFQEQDLSEELELEVLDAARLNQTGTLTLSKEWPIRPG